MESKYIRLMEEYKLARKVGNLKKAEKAFKAARGLVRLGVVSDDELTAAAYL